LKNQAYFFSPSPHSKGAEGKVLFFPKRLCGFGKEVFLIGTGAPDKRGRPIKRQNLESNNLDAFALILLLTFCADP